MTDLLQRRTEQSLVSWMARIERLIRESETPITDEQMRAELTANGINPDDHKCNDPRAWLHVLIEEMYAARPSSESYDGNMWLAQCVGIVTTAWVTRLTHVKAMDAARPIHDRRRAFKAYHELCLALMEIAVDASDDTLVWPHMAAWSHPYAPKPKGGSYR